MISIEGQAIVAVRAGPFSLEGGHKALRLQVTCSTRTRRYLVHLSSSGAFAVRANGSEDPRVLPRLLEQRRATGEPTVEALIERLAGVGYLRGTGRLLVGAGTPKGVREWRTGRPLTPLNRRDPIDAGNSLHRRRGPLADTAVDAHDRPLPYLRELARRAHERGDRAWLAVCGLGSFDPLHDPACAPWLELGYDVVEFELGRHTRVQERLLRLLPHDAHGWRRSRITGTWRGSTRSIGRLAGALARLADGWEAEGGILSVPGHVTVDFPSGVVEFPGTRERWHLAPTTSARLWALVAS
jgi:hypothetical protein